MSRRSGGDAERFDRFRMLSTSPRATAVGLIAILLWGTSVGLLRSITEHFGPIAGAALIYSVSAIALMLFRGLPRFSHLPRGYLLLGGSLFVSYEICLALAIGYATTRSQSLELGLINYLWPALTIILAVFINQQRSRFWLWPGLVITLAGIVLVMQSGSEASLGSLWQNMRLNPLAYSLAFSAALIWALYCNVTRRISQGSNGVTLFFCLTAICLWGMYLLGDRTSIHFSAMASLELVFMGFSTAVAYSAWNYGISQGNMATLASASYFTPVLSALIASLWLGLRPGVIFWQGVGCVVVGSLLCALAVRPFKTGGDK